MINDGRSKIIRKYPVSWMHFIDTNICVFIIDCYSKKNERNETDCSPETVTILDYLLILKEVTLHILYIHYSWQWSRSAQTIILCSNYSKCQVKSILSCRKQVKNI